MPKKIGLINLPLQNDTAFYPLIWLIIKTTIEIKSNNKFDFLDPIIINGTTVDDDYYRSADIMFCSLYTWNRLSSEKILEDYKRINPNGIIIVGGPHILENDTELFDYVCVGEAETCAHLIVDKISGMDVKKIPNTKSKYLHVFYEEKLHDFSVSPYLYQRDTLFDFKNRHPELNLGAVFETNRGCPYGCTFCDWGQATLSKIRQRPLDLIKQEIELFSELKIPSVFLADANFGILPRDIEIAKYMADAKQRTGFIKTVVYSTSKNNMNRNIEIGEIFYNSGLIQSYVFSLQHTDAEVLQVIDRVNLPTNKLKATTEIFLQKRIPTSVQMIIGNPGDTLAKWRRTLMELLEINIHEQIQILYFAMLPGAPASDPDYIKKYDIKTSKINYFPNLGSQRVLDMSESIITSTNTFTMDEWIEMSIFGRYLQAMHDLGLTKVLAIYLHNKNIKSFTNFYSDLYQQLQTNFPELFDSLRIALKTWITTDNSLLTWNPDQVKESIETENKLCFHFIKNKHKFYDSVLQSIKDVADNKIIDLFNWQQDIIIDLEYHPDKGVLYQSKYDWHTWYQNKNWRAKIELRKESSRYIDTIIRSENNLVPQPFSFHKFSDKQRDKMYMHQMIVGLYQRRNRLYLKDLSVTQ